MTIHTLTPSLILKDEEVGTLVTVNDKLYLFVARDPWKAQLVRWYWFDPYLVRLWKWISSKFGSKGDDDGKDCGEGFI